MKPPRITLFARVVLWFFLSVFVVGVAVLAVSYRQLGPDIMAIWRIQASARLRAVSRLIAHDLRAVPRDAWNEVLVRYGEAYEVTFIIVDENGDVVAGPPVQVPPRIREEMAGLPKPPGGRGWRRHMEPPEGPPCFQARAGNGAEMWGGVMLPGAMNPMFMPRPLMLVATATSGRNGLFFDPGPWLLSVALIVIVSSLLWLPLVRSITRPIQRITAATRRIARGDFAVKIDQRRSDEIGQLGRSINDMAARLDGYVRGQRRFLGDVAHELASPAAKIQLGLGVLEQRTAGAEQERVRDVIEDAEHMSHLVAELLSFSRAEISPGKVDIRPIEVAAVVRRVVERERVDGVDIRVEVADDFQVTGDPELLARAVSNLLRNAIRYAGNAGPVTVEAASLEGAGEITVRDQGPGVAELALPHLFEPFFRPDGARERETGGVGLGLAIVKTCVETSGGAVRAQNLKPRGFAVTMSLPLA